MARAADFRFVYANTFGLHVTDNDVTIMLGMTEGFSPEATEHLALVMTPRSLKLLAHVTKLAVDNWEKTNGTAIPLPLEKIKEIESSVVSKPATKP